MTFNVKDANGQTTTEALADVQFAALIGSSGKRTADLVAYSDADGQSELADKGSHQNYILGDVHDSDSVYLKFTKPGTYTVFAGVADPDAAKFTTRLARQEINCCSRSDLQCRQRPCR